MNETERNASTIIPSNTWSHIAFTCVGVAITFENVLMIIVILRDARLRTIANIIITSLAVTDAVVGLTTSMYVVAISHAKLASWICKYLYNGLGNSSFGMVLSSHLHVTAIAIERYVYIVHPFIYFTYVNERFIIKVVLAFWIFVIIFILIGIISGRKAERCLLKDVFEEIAVYVGCFIQLVLLIITSFAYFQIANISLKHRRSIAAQTSGAASHHNNIGSAFTTGNWVQVSRSIRFYLVMTGSLVFLSTPSTICVFVNGKYRYIGANVFRYIVFLPVVQSSTNFLINIFMNSDFRKSIKDLFGRK